MLSLAVGSSAAMAKVVASTTQHANGKLTTWSSLSTATPVSTNGLSSSNLASFKGLQPLNLSVSNRSIFSFKTAVSAVESDQLSSSSSSPNEQQATKYYFVVANVKFMLDEEEHFQELMSERLRLFGERNKEQDFWLVIEPKFLDKFPNITKRLKRPAVALVSTNGPWITYMKLRLDRVLSESYEADSLEEALAFNPTKVEFEKPEKWVAPYTKYESGWWEAFLPPQTKESPV